MADRGSNKNICHILRQRQIGGRRLSQTDLRELDLGSTRCIDLQHVLDDDAYNLANKVLEEYQDKLRTTGATRDDILEMEQVDRVIRPFLPYRFQAMANWWDFFGQLANIADKRLLLDNPRIDGELTVNCAMDCENSVQSIIKSQRFRFLFRVYMLERQESRESDDEDRDEWWCDQLTKLFEQHKYNL